MYNNSIILFEHVMMIVGLPFLITFNIVVLYGSYKIIKALFAHTIEEFMLL